MWVFKKDPGSFKNTGPEAPDTKTKIENKVMDKLYPEISNLIISVENKPKKKVEIDDEPGTGAVRFANGAKGDKAGRKVKSQPYDKDGRYVGFHF